MGTFTKEKAVAYFQNIFQRNFRIIYISNTFLVMKINHLILENTHIKF